MLGATSGKSPMMTAADAADVWSVLTWIFDGLIYDATDADTDADIRCHAVRRRALIDVSGRVSSGYT